MGQNYGFPTQAQQPQSQAQPQQQQQAQPHHQMQQPGAAAGPPGGIQILQPIITPTGEIYQIPIQLNAEQLQMIRAQMMGGAGSSQPIDIQTAPIQTQLANMSRLARRFNFKGASTCTTSSNSTDFTLPQHSLMCPTRCCQPASTPIEASLQPCCTGTELNIAHPITNCKNN